MIYIFFSRNLYLKRLFTYVEIDNRLKINIKFYVLNIIFIPVINYNLIQRNVYYINKMNNISTYT